AAETAAGQVTNPGTFTFTRSGGDLTKSLTVNFNLGGTATANDYTPTLGSSITFAAGSNSEILTITPVNDPLIEGPETVILTLLSDPSYTIGVGNLATITINDNDFINQTLWGTTANDAIIGGLGDDQIAGVPATGTTPTALGIGQIDTLTGGGGKDTFLLADARGTFYNDGSNTSQGINDYALIKDFNSTEDKLQLKKGSQYLFRYANSATEIYLGNGDNSFNAADELIGQIQGVNLTPGTGTWIIPTTATWTTWA
ncbi:MAG: hypothetical protein EBZ76_08400, partial [Synechococcaceae bacterium WB9_2_170]|nr:hypothetical protein [Synechococcaceae bacterium WB9_2_170]